jgi:hypothetical protein
MRAIRASAFLFYQPLLRYATMNGGAATAVECHSALQQEGGGGNLRRAARLQLHYQRSTLSCVTLPAPSAELELRR